MAHLSPRAILAIAVATTIVTSAPIAQECNPSYVKLNDRPDEGNPGWHTEAQGLTHDDRYWYITQNSVGRVGPFGVFGPDPRIWKVPVTRDLAQSITCSSGGVVCTNLHSIQDLVDGGVNHFGDPSYYEYEGRGYILVPLEGKAPGIEGKSLGLAVFDSGDLSFVDYAPFPNSGQTEAGWAAVHSSGWIVTSNSNADQFFIYQVEWQQLYDTGSLSIIDGPISSTMSIVGGDGTALELDVMQGGGFSDNDELLHVSCNCGVYVFRWSCVAGDCSAVAVARSVNGPGGFSFQYDPTWPVKEEPEGLTYWDLENGAAPGVAGQLHVVLLDNDWPDADDVYVKHYRYTCDEPVTDPPPPVACGEDEKCCEPHPENGCSLCIPRSHECP